MSISYNGYMNSLKCQPYPNRIIEVYGVVNYECF
jgi:hypothetical protein